MVDNSVVLERALSYLAADMCVVPIAADGTKRPDLPTWKWLQEQRPDEATVRGWYGGGVQRGVGIIMGRVSGGLEGLDFDRPGFYEPWCATVELNAPGLLARLPRVITPKGFGRHVYWRSDACAPGGLKLAKLIETDREGKPKVQVGVELRSDKQYLLAPGSPAECHSLHREYALEPGSIPIEHVPRITAEERHVLVSAAQALNQVADQGDTEHAIPKQTVGLPGDDYNSRGSWERLLVECGWTQTHVQQGGRSDGVSYWKRPGKAERGDSASLGHCRDDKGNRLLYVFSTNAAPFNADRAYSLFGAYALLKHAGDHRAAASALSQQGFGGGSEAFKEEVRRAIEKVREEVALREKAQTVIEEKLGLWIQNRQLASVKFKATWLHKRPDLENENQYDTSVLWFANDSALDIADCVRLLFLRRLLHNQQPEMAFNVGYMAGKLSRLQAAQSKTDGEAASEVEVKEVVDTAGKPGAVDQVRHRLGIPDFTHLIQLGRHKETFLLAFKDGTEVLIGGVKALGEKATVEGRLIAERDYLGCPPISNWGTVRRYLLETKEVVELQDDVEHVQIETWLDAYLRAHAVPDGPDGVAAARRVKEPYVDEGQLWIHAENLLRWLHLTRTVGGEVALRTLWALLRKAGFVNRTVFVAGSSRSYWSRVWVGNLSGHKAAEEDTHDANAE